MSQQIQQCMVTTTTLTVTASYKLTNNINYLKKLSNFSRILLSFSEVYENDLVTLN